MTKILPYDILNAEGDHVVSCKFAEDAGAMVGTLGEGATVRLAYGGRECVWREGFEVHSALDGYRAVAHTIHKREVEIEAAFYKCKKPLFANEIH